MQVKMGPMATCNRFSSFAFIHHHCRNKENCTGPGCVLNTGKTGQADHDRRRHNQTLRRVWNRQYMTESKGGGRKVIPYPKIGTV